jgi:hypothetical protein
MIKNLISFSIKKKRLIATTTAVAVAVMLAVSVATLGAAPLSVQQPQGGGPPSDRATGPSVTSANIEDETIVSADLQDGAAVRSSDIVDGQVDNADLAGDAVTSDKIEDGQIQADDLDPSLRDGQGTGFGLQVTERSNTIELPRTRGEFTVTVQCNTDEVVTGGGYAASLSPEGTLPTGIPKESRMDASRNGWEVHWSVAGLDASSAPQFAPAQVQVFAECLKVANEGMTSG